MAGPRRHFINLLVLGLIFGGSIFCWLGWFFFDVLNVGVFAAGYDQGETPENAYLTKVERDIYVTSDDAHGDTNSVPEIGNTAGRRDRRTV